ncbi:c-type cytochrome [Simiduia aestuariiviva]|uniref:Cytochrome c553 n=1 Tax=Simiduia aestuariiviva TaxID=1510459 RepID=A0A839UT87_9GAMM|nr:c-type cytochrome [Simiduia aestuariiviva]MBB3169670.1 cytochrome c553 [Simiduia aestuariiviva]
MNKLIKQVVAMLGLVAMSQLAFAGDAKNGESLSTACAACHGADGNSPAPNFPKLAGLGEKYLLKQLLDIQSGARAVPEMAGQLDGMSAQDLADMAAYFNGAAIQLSGSKKDAEVQLNSGAKVNSLALGARTYRAGNMETNVPACLGCHSPGGTGNDPAGYPRLGGQHAAYIEKQLKDFRAGNRTNDGDNKIMRDVAAQLSDAEISALANFIAGLHP